MNISLYSPEECEKIAREASLRYIRDTSPGISRKRCGKGFSYYQSDGSKISDQKLLTRIKSLAIPPAYHDVWICPFENGHIQATGRDNKNRKQYRYHSLWQEIRQQQKFNVMIQFGQALSSIRTHINQELNKPVKLNKTQIICAIIYLLDNYNIRVGNSIYAKENKSYGLTTLRKKHLSIKENKAILNFEGKNSKLWQVILNDKKIIRVLKKCEEIPGYELFKYHDENNHLNVINSQEVNAYLQSLTNHSFTAKDFRTWIACRETLCRLINIEYDNNSFQEKLKIIIAEVADLLGHTPGICQKNYIYPEIINAWKEMRLANWVHKHGKKIATADEDTLLLSWLKSREREKNI